MEDNSRLHSSSLTIRNGFVLYQKLAANKGRGYWGDLASYWHRIYNRGITEGNAITGIFPNEAQYVKAGESLIALGKQERLKETRLIEAATGTVLKTDIDIKDFCNNFNEVLMGKANYKKALDRLTAALDENNQDAGVRAPTIASWFTSYLGTALNEKILKFANENTEDLINKDYKIWEQELDDIVKSAIHLAMRRMLTEVTKKKERDNVYGDKEDWKVLWDAYNSIGGFRSDFEQMIYSQLDIGNLKNIFENERIHLEKRKKGIRAVLDSQEGLNLRNESKSRSLGGNVNEFLNAMIQSIGGAVEKAASSGSKVISTNIIKTDNVSLFSYSGTIDDPGIAQKIVDELNDSLTPSKSLLDAKNRMEKFYKERLSKLDKSFIVYGNAKSYSLSENFRGFTNDSGRKLEDAIEIVEAAGFGNKEALMDLIHLSYNTAAGAIMDGRRNAVVEEIKTALMGSIAQLMFDDWISIGDNAGGAEAIHVLELEGIQLPLSILLNATGEAMIKASEEMDRYVSISVKPIEKIQFGDITASSREEALENWQTQADTAQKESYFSVHFLKNFKSIIMEYVGA